MHVGRNHERRRQRPIDAISGDLCINGCKTVSVYYGFIQHTSHAIILFVDDGTIIINKSASSKIEIARVLEHRWIQRRVVSIEGFCDSSLAVLMLFVSKIWRYAFIMGRENVGLNWHCGMRCSTTFSRL